MTNRPDDQHFISVLHAAPHGGYQFLNISVPDFFLQRAADQNAKLERRKRYQLNANSPVRANVLSISDDPVLLRTRHMVLELAGYQVKSASSLSILEEDEIRQFDLALICHSVEKTRVAALASSLRNINSHLRIIQLFSTHGESITGLQRIASSQPEELLWEMSRILARNAERKENTSFTSTTD